jgi:HSP20 family molecular chaperone IbpA
VPDAEKAEQATDAVAKMDEESKNTKRYVHKGIKRPGTATVSYFVDPQYFDKEKIEARIKDGILHVKVGALPEPAKERKQIEIQVD